MLAVSAPGARLLFPYPYTLATVGGTCSTDGAEFRTLSVSPNEVLLEMVLKGASPESYHP